MSGHDHNHDTTTFFPDIQIIHSTIRATGHIVFCETSATMKTNYNYNCPFFHRLIKNQTNRFDEKQSFLLKDKTYTSKSSYIVCHTTFSPLLECAGSSEIRRTKKRSIIYV